MPLVVTHTESSHMYIVQWNFNTHIYSIQLKYM